jgi:integrase
LRGVLKTCWRLGQMSAEQYQRAIDLGKVKGSTLLSGRLITPAEMRALVDVCTSDPSLHGARDAAMFAVLFGVGLRRQEVVGLDLDDYNDEDGELMVRHGKGDKQRTNYASGGAAEAIEYWIERRGDERGALFLPITKGPNGKVRMRRLNSQAVMDIMLKRSREAGIRHCSPHDTRRTYISSLLANGIDIKTVANMVGHTDVKTTANYDRRGEDAKRRASEAFHFPFVRPDAALPEPRKTKGRGH